MEFKFRAGEVGASNNIPPNPSTTTMFTRQQNLRGAVLSNDNGRTQPDVESNPVAISEATQREIEKRQIREEILAAEITRRRELEAEVRRELMEERARTYRGLPVQLNSPAVQLLPKTSAEQVNPVNSNVVGMKRKAETLSTCGAEKQTQRWTCDLCKVSTTDERGLQFHLKGKKHKIKERRVSDLLLCSKGKQAVSTGSLNPKDEENSNEEKVIIDNVGDGCLPVDTKQHKMKCWCHLCKFETNSEAEMISAHMMGQMHKTLLLENGGCVIVISTLPEYAQDTEKAAGAKEDDGQSLHNAEERIKQSRRTHD